MSKPFEYAVLKVVPRVERGECINAGVVLYCQADRFLGARVHLDADRLTALDPAADLEAVRAHLEAFRSVCAGGPEAGGGGGLPPPGRFGRLGGRPHARRRASEGHNRPPDEPRGQGGQRT